MLCVRDLTEVSVIGIYSKQHGFLIMIAYMEIPRHEFRVSINLLGVELRGT